MSRRKQLSLDERERAVAEREKALETLLPYIHPFLTKMHYWLTEATERIYSEMPKPEEGMDAYFRWQARRMAMQDTLARLRLEVEKPPRQ
jgi:hypothetical protein